MHQHRFFHGALDEIGDTAQNAICRWACGGVAEGNLTMTKGSLEAWALANGWQMIDGYPSLTKPSRPSAPAAAIVRLVLKTTVASLEIKKPAGKWEKVASEGYAKIEPDPDNGIPGGLGLATMSGLTQLMQDNKDRMVFGR